MHNVDTRRISGIWKLLLSVDTPRNEAQTLSQEKERSFLPTAHIFLLAQQFPQREGAWHSKLAVIPCQQMCFPLSVLLQCGPPYSTSCTDLLV